MSFASHNNESNSNVENHLCKILQSPKSKPKYNLKIIINKNPKKSYKEKIKVAFDRICGSA